jgi:pimeloyl-ACP methyl ester carboxylesterase
MQTWHATLPQPGGSPAGADARHPDRERLLAGLPVADRRMTLAGIPTAVLEGGDGPPLVLLHGQGELAATWMRVIPELARSHRVIAPDLPGHGASGVGAGALDAEGVLAWMDALIARTCPEPPVVVGHLLGGAIALRHALERGGRVRRLVLVDSLGLGPYRPALRFALAMAAFVAMPGERTQERLFRGCFVDLDGLRVEMGEEWHPLAAYALECARTPELQAALRSLMPRFGLRAIPAAELERLAVPAGLIWGREDRQVRLGIAEAAKARYGWPLHVIENAGDDPPFEQPEAFLRALRAELAAPAAAEVAR